MLASHTQDCLALLEAVIFSKIIVLLLVLELLLSFFVVICLRVELLNEQTLESELFTSSPTLSSLVLSYTKPMIDSAGDRVNRILDFESSDQQAKPTGKHEVPKSSEQSVDAKLAPEAPSSHVESNSTAKS